MFFQPQILAQVNGWGGRLPESGVMDGMRSHGGQPITRRKVGYGGGGIVVG